MKAILQRVNSAAVTVDDVITGSCNFGLMILLGVMNGDSEKEADALVKKIANLRIFRDENGRLNKSLLDVKGEVLIISNFTLSANYTHGNRPDYMSAAAPDEANRLYEYFCEAFHKMVEYRTVGRGVFGAHMRINADLCGPVTIVMDSEKLKKEK